MNPKMLSSIRSATITALLPQLVFYLTLTTLFIFYGGYIKTNIISKNNHCLSSSFSPSSNDNNVQILIQISDLHISNNRNYIKSKYHLSKFINESLKCWANITKALVITGDVVNAIKKYDNKKRYFGTSSFQYEHEWNFLNTSLNNIREKHNKLSVLLTYGNHDTFGGKHKFLPTSNEQKTKVTEFDDGLKLIGLDFTQQHAIHRPLNFFGDVNHTIPVLKSKISASDMVMLYSHYPTSLLKSGRKIQMLLNDEFMVYISGHLHTLYGYAPKGLSSIYKQSGSFELQAIDMATSGAFRVFIIDSVSSSITFETFYVNQTTSSPSLNDVMLLNPPVQGFCTPGSGTKSLTLSHIRLFSPPGLNLLNLNITVKIDGSFHLNDGLVLLDEKYNVYGIEWNSTVFKHGIHDLLIYTHNQSKTFKFSIDGSANLNPISILRRLIHSLLLVSDYETMSKLLSSICLTISMLLCIPGLKYLNSFSIILFVYCFTVLGGWLPLLCAKDIGFQDNGWGFVTLYKLIVSSGVYEVAVDSPFHFSTRVLWPVVLPICYIDFISKKRFNNNELGIKIGMILVNLKTIRQCWAWSSELYGAYGFSSFLISPCCFPLLILSIYSLIINIRPTKNNPKKQE